MLEVITSSNSGLNKTDNVNLYSLDPNFFMDNFDGLAADEYNL